jgi:hypothetical protein
MAILIINPKTKEQIVIPSNAILVYKDPALVVLGNAWKIEIIGLSEKEIEKIMLCHSMGKDYKIEKPKIGIFLSQ